MTSANRLKIAIVTETHLPEVNGVSRSLDRMLKGIQDKGHEVITFRPAQPTDRASFWKLAMDSVSGLTPEQRWLRDSSVAQAFGRLEKSGISARAKAEAVNPEEQQNPARQHICMGLRMPFYKEVQVGLASPHFFRSRFRKDRPDLVHLITEGPLGLNALLAARSCGIPVISDYRTHFDQYFSYYGMSRLGKAVAWYLRLFHNFTRRTLVPTREMKDELSSAGFKRVQVIGRGVDLQSYSPEHRDESLRIAYGVKGTAPLVLYAGRLAPEKNIDLAVAAFREMQKVRSDARMVLVGDGPERALLEKENPDLTFTGFLSGADLSVHYASSDIFLFPSLTDTFGNVVTEAAASGLAVLAYDKGAAREILEDGLSARVVSQLEPGAYLQAAREMARTSLDSLHGMRVQARQVATAHDWEAIVDRLEDTYFDALVKKVRFRSLVQNRMRKAQFQ